MAQHLDISKPNAGSERRQFADYSSKDGGRGSKLSATEAPKKRNRLTDLQILQQIDVAEDPEGKYALRKIDFSNGGISCGRKEFSSKSDALAALEMSKTRVSEVMMQARSKQLDHFKKSVGKTIKEDHIVASMPRIRISAAKSQQRNSTFIGASKRNFFPGKEAEQMIGGLTPGNLSKIGGTDGDSRVASAINPVGMAGHRASQDDMGSETSPQTKQRRQFARGISLQTNEKTGSQLRNMIAIAPSAHHRFDKDNVHLRSMYRQLYPSSGPQTTKNAHTYLKEVGSIEDIGDYSQDRKPLLNKNGQLVNSKGFSTSFSRRETHPVSMDKQRLHLAMHTQSSQRNSNIFQMNTTNLLQNTPLAVDLHKSTFLDSMRFKNHVNAHGAISPPIQSSPTSGMSRSNILGLTGQSTYAMRSHTLRNNATAVGSKIFLEDNESKIVTQRIENLRPQPRFIMKQTESSDEEENEQFMVNPAEDIPRNKLVDKLVRGLQSYIQRMQKRESFRIDVQLPADSKWLPAPRECATLTTVGYNMYLMGGLNYDACREIISAKINGDSVIWERIPYTSTEPVQGRQCHTSVAHSGKIYTFGGCFMFNKKRQVRECTNQLLEFDTYERRMTQCKTVGISAGARKNHVATVFKKSMIVYGGQTESGVFYNEMIVLHLDHLEWIKISLKQGMAPFIQGACCSVLSNKRGGSNDQELGRKSDSIQDGVYFFGGKNAKGELQNKLRYFKPVVIDGKVVHGEFVQLKVTGQPPAPRFGHTMSYLPCNNSILIAGGRNDSLSASNMTPFLNDLVLFMLDQKVWLNVKYSVNSDRISHMGNHSMAVVCDNESYEKLLIFGGISNQVGESIEEIRSCLSNKAFLITLNSRSQAKSLFKAEGGAQQNSMMRAPQPRNSGMAVNKAALGLQ